MNKQSERKLISPKGGAGAPVPGPGRPKGSQNKLSRTSKENIAWVFDAIGGASALKKWAESSLRNRTIFYTQMYTKLIALEIAHSGQVNLIISNEFLPQEKK